MQDQQFDPDPGFFEQYGPLILIGGLVLAVTAIGVLQAGSASKDQPVVANRHEAEIEKLIKTLIKSRMRIPSTYRHVRTDSWVDDDLTTIKITYRENTRTEDAATKWLAATFSETGVVMWYYGGEVDANSNGRRPSPAESSD